MARPLAQLDLFGGAPTPVAPRGQGVGAAEVSPALFELARRLPPTLFMGTSSWSNPGWAGIVFDQPYAVDRLARGGLAAYAEHPLLRMVGVDRSYYAPLTPGELARYADSVPEGFRFLMKAHEAVTTAFYPRHARYGVRRGRASEEFLDPAYARFKIIDPFVQVMGERGGPILFQFAPQDVAGLGGPRRFAERLHRFLLALPRGPLYAVELRNAELVCPEYGDALADVGACHCVNVFPGMPAPHLQASRAGIDRGPALVIRWMLQPSLTYDQARALFEPFDRLALEDPVHRAALADLIVDAARIAKPTYFIANNKAEGSSPLTIIRLAEAIVQRLGGGPRPA